MSLKSQVALLAVGAGAAYFLDREQGRQRCEQLKEQFASIEDLVEDLVSAGEDASTRVNEFVEQLTENPGSVLSSPLAKSALGSMLLIGGLRSAGLTALLCGGAGLALLARRNSRDSSNEKTYDRWHATNLTH